MKLPTLFVGHGSPMIALENTEITKNFKKIGNYIIDEYERPKAILAISAHWFTRGNFTQNEDNPRQIYDMYGFPKELYEVKYHVNGDHVLTDKILNLLKNDDIKLNQQWGIDHGTWTVLVHMFPEADIPVVQLSVNASIGEREVFKIGKKLKDLRDEGYLILGSGNIVHNLRYVDWEKKDASLENREFDKFIVENVLSKNFENVINYDKNPYSSYAVPSKDHFYPLIYVLGASDNYKVEVFNQVGSLASISMTSFIFK